MSAGVHKPEEGAIFPGDGIKRCQLCDVGAGN